MPSNPHPPTHRRRRPRRRHIPGFVWRIGGVVLGCTLAAALSLPLYHALVEPMRLHARVGSEVAQLEQRLALKRKENAHLRQRIVYLHSSEGLEALARKYGYHRPGEVVYLMPREPASPPPTTK